MIASIPLPDIIIAFLIITVLIVLAVKISQMERKLHSFMAGRDGASLESTLQWLTKKISEIDETLLAHKEGLEILDKRVQKSVRGLSLVHYDAYESDGGLQSFASTSLDEHQNGFVLSVITNRNHVGIYAKKINRGTPQSNLSVEENDSLELAKKSLL